jgi:serine/threonine protein kinase
MTPTRFQTIEEVYRAALDQEPDQISAFLDTACEGDAILRRKVEALLSSRDQAADFIETSAVGLATKVIQNQQGDLLIGQTIGHYKISELLGTGGMGEVYLATDIVAGRKAALKLLPFRFTGDAERLKRFQQEARAVVALNHPNILTVYEIGEDHSTHYIASELIEGETLRQRLDRGRMQLSEAVEIATQVTSALLAAHEAGVVHRDIKPENIMLRPDGYVKVLDFGIAKLAEQEGLAAMPKDQALLLVETNLGSVLGTARYMSPEQACGALVDKRTDIWSLGVLLYEMVTGHAPFTGDTPGEVMFAILEKEPSPVRNYIARTSPELQQMISKTLRKNRDERYQGAPELLDALKDFRRKLEAKSQRAAAPLWLRWARSPAAVALALIAAALAVTLLFQWNRKPTTSFPLEKSIAVLPFANLSKDEENEFFAGGVQDEILTNLAKVADLKVISRTSVARYKSDLERNLRDIAKTLGVSHVVEGSVQRAGERIRVNVQLIDAHNDAHLWAEHYDRDAADVFAIQSEIAQQIADRLRSKLSPAERAAIAERPTADLIAYELYTEAKARGQEWWNWKEVEQGLNEIVQLLEEATRRDPNFALAYCDLANVQCDLFSATGARAAEAWTHLELARKAAETAARLRPDLGQAHLELARYQYFANLHTSDFARAREELAIARRSLPNDSEATLIAARIDKRQNRWDDSLANLERAAELDPANPEVAFHRRRTLFEMRRYTELEQRLADDIARGLLQGERNQVCLAELKLAEGHPVAAQALLAQVPMDFSAIDFVWQIRLQAALYLRDYDGATRVIAATPAKSVEGLYDGQPPESRVDAEIERARGHTERALTVFAAARKRLEATWETRYKDAPYQTLEVLAEFDAGLGRKEDAIREALRAVSLMPIAKDSYWGPHYVKNLAMVYAWTGEHDRAFEQLETVAIIPNGPTYGDLRFNPCWDDLRGDPRFDKIIAAAKAASR